MFGLFGKKNKQVSPIRELVFSRFGDDSFIKENKIEEREFVNIAFISLTIGFNEASRIKDDKPTKKLFRSANEDIIAFELALFTLLQARKTIYTNYDDADEDGLYVGDYDYDDQYFLEEIRKAAGFASSLYEREYDHDDVNEWFKDRERNYGRDPKHACECLSFNLAAGRDVDNFKGLSMKTPNDLTASVAMMALSPAFQQTMVPGFIQSIERLIAINEYDM